MSTARVLALFPHKCMVCTAVHYASWAVCALRARALNWAPGSLSFSLAGTLPCIWVLLTAPLRATPSLPGQHQSSMYNNPSVQPAPMPAPQLADEASPARPSKRKLKQKQRLEETLRDLFRAKVGTPTRELERRDTFLGLFSKMEVPNKSGECMRFTTCTRAFDTLSRILC
jgi:hypothetical protein